MAKTNIADQLIDLRHPEVSGLIPSLVYGTKMTKLESPLTTDGIINQARRNGLDYNEVSLSLFRETKFGKARRKDNSDMISGYPQYGVGSKGISNLRSAVSFLKDFGSTFMDDVSEKSPVLADMENEDFKKLSILRPVFWGRHYQPPISPTFKRVIFPEPFLAIAKQVIKRYAQAATYTKSGRSAILDGTDAKATALGSPSFQADDVLYHQYRRLTLKAIPPPDYSRPPGEYLSNVLNFASSMFHIPEFIISSYLSYRQGATNKPIPLWFPSGFGGRAEYEATGIYTRQRAVWAAPFWLNVLVTPLVLRMKSSRKAILGMWHEPALQARYIPFLQKQGSKSYEIDYSGYDTTISNELLAWFYEQLAQAGFATWESELMAQVTRMSGAITPSFTNTTDAVSFFNGNVTLMSGLLTTSEIGSIISISLVLYALSRQDESFLKRWLNGSFVILVQSDDVLFTTDVDIDIERFSADLAKCGITAKMKEGSTFLKRFLPVGHIKKLSRPISRISQQTFGNEDRYDGKIDAILRLALSARCDGVQNHPYFNKYWPTLLEGMRSHFDYIKDLDWDSWIKGKFVISPRDLKAIQEYATSLKGAIDLTSLIERAKFDPSAQAMLDHLLAFGIDLSSLITDQIKARAEYVSDLFSTPTQDDIRKLLAICKWNF